MSIVEQKAVCKTYPSFRLKEVSFSLEKGRITGVIGRNGAGKTTTIKSMINLIHTDSGEVLYIGLQLTTLLAWIIIYILLTLVSYNKSCDNFDKIDL